MARNVETPISVNVGLPREIEWQGKLVRTAIWKHSVTHRVFARGLNLDAISTFDICSQDLLKVEGRIEVIKLLPIGILSIAVLHGSTYAWGQMACSVTHQESKNLEGHQNALRSLIEERLSLMTDVARTKWNSGSAIEDPIREQQLLADVGVKAQTAGISAEWAQHFFRFQIEAAKEVQYCLFAQWTAERQGPFPAVQDLRTGIRPKLDQLTVKLLQELARQWPELSRPGLPEQNDSLSERSTNKISTRLALLPLSDGSLQSYGHVQAVKSR